MTGTKLIYNNAIDMYEAVVEGDLIQVDDDSYALVRRDIMHDMAEVEGITERDLADWPEDVYDRLYWAADDEINTAEVWLARPMRGLFVNGEAQW